MPANTKIQRRKKSCVNVGEGLDQLLVTYKSRVTIEIDTFLECNLPLTSTVHQRFDTKPGSHVGLNTRQNTVLTCLR